MRIITALLIATFTVQLTFGLALTYKSSQASVVSDVKAMGGDSTVVTLSGNQLLLQQSNETTNQLQAQTAALNLNGFIVDYHVYYDDLVTMSKYVISCDGTVFRISAYTKSSIVPVYSKPSTCQALAIDYSHRLAFMFDQIGGKVTAMSLKNVSWPQAIGSPVTYVSLGLTGGVFPKNAVYARGRLFVSTTDSSEVTVIDVTQLPQMSAQQVAVPNIDVWYVQKWNNSIVLISGTALSNSAALAYAFVDAVSLTVVSSAVTSSQFQPSSVGNGNPTLAYAPYSIIHSDLQNGSLVTFDVNSAGLVISSTPSTIITTGSGSLIPLLVTSRTLYCARSTSIYTYIGTFNYGSSVANTYGTFTNSLVFAANLTSQVQLSTVSPLSASFVRAYDTDATYPSGVVNYWYAATAKTVNFDLQLNGVSLAVSGQTSSFGVAGTFTDQDLASGKVQLFTAVLSGVGSINITAFSDSGAISGPQIIQVIIGSQATSKSKSQTVYGNNIVFTNTGFALKSLTNDYTVIKTQTSTVPLTFVQQYVENPIYIGPAVAVVLLVFFGVVIFFVRRRLMTRRKIFEEVIKPANNFSQPAAAPAEKEAGLLAVYSTKNLVAPAPELISLLGAPVEAPKVGEVVATEPIRADATIITPVDLEKNGWNTPAINSAPGVSGFIPIDWNPQPATKLTDADFKISTRLPRGANENYLGQITRESLLAISSEDTALVKIVKGYEEAPNPVVALEQEVSLMVSLGKHKCFGKFIGYLETPSTIIFKLYQLGSIDDLLFQQPSLPTVSPQQSIVWARDIVEGIAVMHRVGVIHNDIKSSNVMLEGNATGQFTNAVITDFGAVTVVDQTFLNLNGRRAPRGLGHSVRFASPELIKMTADKTMIYNLVPREVDKATDMYSLAIVLFEIVGMEKAWADAKSVAEVERNVQDGRRPRFGTAGYARVEQHPGLKTLGELLDQCWTQDCFSRPTAEHILECIHAIDLKL